MIVLFGILRQFTNKTNLTGATLRIQPSAIVEQTRKQTSNTSDISEQNEQASTIVEQNSQQTSTIVEQNQQTSNGPRAILHIGPHKTGTTTLQHFIKEAHAVRTMARDNVSVPLLDAMPGSDRRPEFNFVHCVLRPNTKHCRSNLFPALSRYVNKTYSAGKDILVVAEDFDRDEIECKVIQESLLPYTDVQIVIAYRRLHFWFKSW